MGSRPLQGEGGRTVIRKKLTCGHFKLLVIKVGQASKWQSSKDPACTRQIQVLHLPKGIQMCLPSHRSIVWTVTVQKDWKERSQQLCYSCIIVEKLLWKLCGRRLYPYYIHTTVVRVFIRMHKTGSCFISRTCLYSLNTIPRWHRATSLLLLVFLSNYFWCREQVQCGKEGKGKLNLDLPEYISGH